MSDAEDIENEIRAIGKKLGEVMANREENIYIVACEYAKIIRQREGHNPKLSQAIMGVCKSIQDSRDRMAVRQAHYEALQAKHTPDQNWLTRIYNA